MIGHQLLPAVPCDIDAEALAERLRKRIRPLFIHDEVKVVLDPAPRILSVMAYATATQRLRTAKFDLQLMVDCEDELIADCGIGA